MPTEGDQDSLRLSCALGPVGGFRPCHLSPGSPGGSKRGCTQYEFDTNRYELIAITLSR